MPVASAIGAGPACPCGSRKGFRGGLWPTRKAFKARNSGCRAGFRWRFKLAVKAERLDRAAELGEEIESVLVASSRVADEIFVASFAHDDHEVGDAIGVAQAHDHRVAPQEIPVDKEVGSVVLVIVFGHTGGNSAAFSQ